LPSLFFHETLFATYGKILAKKICRLCQCFCKQLMSEYTIIKQVGTKLNCPIYVESVARSPKSGQAVSRSTENGDEQG